MTTQRTRERRATVISSLDEKYVANAVAFAALHAAATLIVDGDGLRRPDGTVDRRGFRARIEALTWFAPEMRQRLVRTPLGLSAPAWVPVPTLDMNYHVRFHDGIEADDPGRADLLAGRLSPVMDMTRPLWDFDVIDLDSQRIAIVFRWHHVMGDAMFGMRIGEVITATSPSAPPRRAGETEVSALGAAPRTGIGVLLAVQRQWRAQHPGTRAAWRAYWRKPLRKRIRRWGGRLLRPAKDLYIARTGVAERVIGTRSSAYAVLDAAAVTETARRLGGSVNDLTVAAALRATALQRPDADEISIIVPFSRRKTAGERNAVGVVTVTVASGAELADIVASVRTQVQAAVRGGSPARAAPRTPVGYATAVSWGRTRRFFDSALVDVIAGWPAGDPTNDLACLACVCGPSFVISATIRDSFDIAAFMDSVRTSLGGSDAPALSRGGAPATTKPSKEVAA